MGSLKWMLQPNGFLKIIALVINILVLTLMTLYGLPVYGMNVSELLLIITTVGGFALVLLILLVGYGVDNNFLKAPAQVFVSGIVGTILSLVSGSLIIHRTRIPPDLITYDRAPALYAYGILIIINSLVFLADSFFAFKSR